MTAQQIPVVFPCNGETLVGMIHRPSAPVSRGVVVVVGGPQYRIGSHRQFLLLARELCSRGIAVMRFDYRGMGDSTGEPVDFMATGPDIRAAIDTLLEHVSEVESVALWGLCDAASGVLAYGHSDARVDGLVILNPWVRSEAGLARTTLREYYLGRIADPAFWRGLFSGKVNIGAAVRSLADTVTSVFRPRSEASSGPVEETVVAADDGAFIETMRAGLAKFSGPVLLVLSGDDLTAGEFRDVARGRPWRKLLSRKNVTRRELDSANHTFSRAEWRTQVADWTWEWLQAW
ncbi:MAG: hydrolase 1, exosortase A system-associated [Pseudomonadota bacterium]